MPNELRFDWPGLPAPHFGQVDTAVGAKVLANILSAPQRAENARIEAAQGRALARSFGMPEDQINALIPGDDVPQPIGGSGILGKLTSGVGRVGATLSSILGAPVPPPRFTPNEAKSIEEGAAREALVHQLDPNDPDFNKKRALVRLGKYDEVFPGVPKNSIELAGQEGTRRGLTGQGWYDFVSNEVARMTGLQTGARVDATTRAKQQSAHDAAIEWNKNHTDPNEQVPVPPAPSDQVSGTGGSTEPGSGMGGGGSGDTLADRNNNPGNIKSSRLTQTFPGVVQVADAATDGGNFLKFDSPQSGFKAMGMLLMHPGGGYRNMTVGAALHRWSGGGYGADIAQAAGLDPNQLVSSLTPDQMNTLTHTMAKREGWTGGVSQQPPQQQAAQPKQPEGMVGQPPPGTQTAAADTGTMTDASGNVVNAAPVTVPYRPGVSPSGQGTALGPTKKEIDTGAGKITYTDPELAKRDPEVLTKGKIMFGTTDLTPEQLNAASEAVRHEKITGRPLNVIDLATIAVGGRPGEDMTPDGAQKVMDYLQRYKSDPGLNGQLARAKIAEIWFDRLDSPVKAVDPKTANYIIDPKTGQPKVRTNPDGSPMRAIDALATDPLAASIPFASSGLVEWNRRKGDEAAALLFQAQAGLTNLAKAMGETGRVPVQEQQRLRALIPVPGEDTMQSAAVKIRQGKQLMQDIQKELISRGGSETGPQTQPGAGRLSLPGEWQEVD